MKTKLPAGILSGVEAFWHNNEKWVLCDGNPMLFDDAPGAIQRMIANAFMADKQSQHYLKRQGVTSFSNGFELWYKCVLGALDDAPDFINDTFTPDYFNNSCKDYDCPHRGKFCSVAAGLKDYEVKSLDALRNGHTIEESAEILYVSIGGMKSRYEKLKEKFGARNVAQLAAKAAEMGI